MSLTQDICLQVNKSLQRDFSLLWVRSLEEIRAMNVLPEEDPLFHVHINGDAPRSMTGNVQNLEPIAAKSEAFLRILQLYINLARLIGYS